MIRPATSLASTTSDLRRSPIGQVELDRPAGRGDLDLLPTTWRGEIIQGSLYAFPRPRGAHQRAATRISGDIDGPFDRGRGGPGGWIILEEPGIELPGAVEFSPDIAGWRRETLPKLPRKGPITVVPDWVCEVLSPATRAYDMLVKRRFHAQIGVSHLWYVDPLPRLITAAVLTSGQWLELGTWGNDEQAHIPPFDAVTLDLSAWWADVEQGPSEDDETSPEPPSGTT